MENKHSTDGIAEDIIRSFVQVAVAEMHMKTLLEKRVSELENGMIDLNKELDRQLSEIGNLKAELEALAELRRADMLFLFELYGGTGDKEQWCMVKHLGISSITAFEAWQASNDNEFLLSAALRKNQLFIKAITKFLGVEITECAACFADILKGAKNNETSNL